MTRKVTQERGICRINRTFLQASPTYTGNGRPSYVTSIPDKSDVKLVEAALAGGPEAFGPIVQRYRDAVFGVALARLGDFHEAEDQAQQVFVDAYQRLDTLKDPGRLGAWLRSIAIHGCIDILRRRREVRPAALESDMQASREPSPPAQLERRELRDQVLAAISRLSKTQRETTTLFYVNGYSIEQVAAMQEAPVGTIKRRLHDARERLKEEMIGMVEDVLKSEAPKDDFAQRVFRLLSGLRPRRAEDRLPWGEVVAELRKIGTRGAKGFAKALESPHSGTRVTAAAMAGKIDNPQELLVDLLIRSLADPNRKVRRFALDSLLNLRTDDKRKRRQFVPLVVPLLGDPSRRVRRAAAYELIGYWQDVPIDAVVQALLAEADHESLKRLKMLLHPMVHGGERKFYTH